VVDSTAELDRALISEADVARAQAGAFFVDRSIQGSDEPARLLVLPVDLDGRRLAVVVGESLEPREEALENLLTLLWIGGPLLLLLAAVGAYALAGRALRPVSELLGRVEAALARERRFVADASHELRTPLAALRTELELALRRPRSREELEAALRSAAEETDRLSHLAEDLLVLARAQDGKLPVRKEDLAAAELLGTVNDRYAGRALAAGRSLAVQADDGLRLSGDRLRLEQALGNLVENALRYGEGTIHLGTTADDDTIALFVRDEGPGFPPEFVAEAFERFTRADQARSRGGAGLGLSIVQAIARAHGGQARAANDPDGGAKVLIELPAGDEAGSRAENGVAHEPSGA
jgi:two-component system, OmpR family, sensor kinase